MTRLFSKALLASGLLVLPWAAQANILFPGDILPPDALTVGLNNPLPAFTGNAVLLDSTGIQTSTMGSAGTQTNYIENVYRDPNATAVCPLGNCLTFVIAAINIGPTIIEHITTASFAGFATDVGIQAPDALDCLAAGATNVTCIIDSTGSVFQPFAPASGHLQKDPAQGKRSPMSDNGATISFEYTPPPASALTLDPGDSTTLLVIETDATGYIAGTLGFIDGSGASGFGFAPAPEPRFVGLALMGLFGIVAFIVRRRKLQAAE